MPGIILSDYFCGDGSEGFIYPKIPAGRSRIPKSKHVSTDAKAGSLRLKNGSHGETRSLSGIDSHREIDFLPIQY